MAIRQITGGNFQDAMGNPLNAGYVTFRLSTDGSASGTQVSAGIVTKAVLDSSGNISGNVYLWPNDQLVPATTVYIVKVFTASGELCWGSENVIPSGIGSFDIGTWIPLY
jgi:hypothetical protein